MKALNALQELVKAFLLFGAFLGGAYALGTHRADHPEWLLFVAGASFVFAFLAVSTDDESDEIVKVVE